MKLFSWFENKNNINKTFNAITTNVNPLEAKRNPSHSMWPIAKVKVPTVNNYSLLTQKKALSLPISTQIASTNKIILEAKNPS